MQNCTFEEVIEETKRRVWDCPKSKVGSKRNLSLEKKVRSPFSLSKQTRIAFSCVLNYCPKCVCVCVCLCLCTNKPRYRIDIEPVPCTSQGVPINLEYNGSALSVVVQWWFCFQGCRTEDRFEEWLGCLKIFLPAPAPLELNLLGLPFSNPLVWISSLNWSQLKAPWLPEKA